VSKLAGYTEGLKLTQSQNLRRPIKIELYLADKNHGFMSHFQLGFCGIKALSNVWATLVNPLPLSTDEPNVCSIERFSETSTSTLEDDYECRNENARLHETCWV
jgi:hypothetical protein